MTLALHRAKFELAGMVSEQGILGGVWFSNRGVAVPKAIRLQGDRLLWSSDDYREADPKGMLEAFIRIGDAADVLRFAGRFGILGICEHGLPASHNPAPPGYPTVRFWEPCRPLGWMDGNGECWEPLDRWFFFAGEARALLNIAENLRRGLAGSPDDWRAIYANHPKESVDELCEALGRSVKAGRHYISFLLWEWLTWGNLKPALHWPTDETQPSLVMQTGGTFGFLGLELLSALTGAHSIAACSGCGTPYLAERRPRPDRRNFCPACGPRVAARLRQRDHRARRQREPGARRSLVEKRQRLAAAEAEG